jgi:hypothetical protein
MLHPNGFTGTAKLSISSDGESLIIQPIEGRQGIIEFNTNVVEYLLVNLKNGAPFKGVDYL